MRTKYFKLLFILLIAFLHIQIVFPNILPETYLKTGLFETKSKLTQNLKVGDKVLSFKPKNLNPNNSCIEFITIPIKKIIKIKLKKLILIKTNLGTLSVGENQKFYNAKSNNWVNSKDLTTNDILLDINLNKISIEKITVSDLEEEIEAYDLLLDEPHTFFICDSNNNPLLVHNFSVPFSVIEHIIENGETLINRDFSSEQSKNKPTLEIQYSKYDYLKIRYDN